MQVCNPGRNQSRLFRRRVPASCELPPREPRVPRPDLFAGADGRASPGASAKGPLERVRGWGSPRHTPPRGRVKPGPCRRGQNRGPGIEAAAGCLPSARPRHRRP